MYQINDFIQVGRKKISSFEFSDNKKTVHYVQMIINRIICFLYK